MPVNQKHTRTFPQNNQILQKPIKKHENIDRYI